MAKLLDENSLLAIKTYIDAIALTLAPAFNESVSYTTGDIVTYQNKLYKANQNNTGTWDSSEWDEVDVITLISQSQSIKSLNTNNYASQSVSSNESITGSGSINLHAISKTGKYSDLVDKPIKTLKTYSKTINKSVVSILATDIWDSYTFGEFANCCIPTAIVYSGQDSSTTQISVTIPVYASTVYNSSDDENEVDINELWILDNSTGKLEKIGTQDGFSALKAWMTAGGLDLVSSQRLVIVNY